MSDAQVERQLNIKTGVVTRYAGAAPGCVLTGTSLSKEERMYAKEAQDQEAVVKQYRDQGRDAFDIKKQVCGRWSSDTRLPRAGGASEGLHADDPGYEAPPRRCGIGPLGVHGEQLGCPETL